MGLNNYRLLGKSGLRVSPLALGTMTFGKEWGHGVDEEESRRVFDIYADRGGNFIDTANVYNNGTAEKFVGNFIKGRRQKFVVATKYAINTDSSDPNAGGNHRKNMIHSIDGSLKRLQSDYVDLFWIHAWDQRTPIDEILRGLDALVKQGKILHIGFSDVPAWKVAQANTMADIRGLASFIALQMQYNLLERSIEREIIPMTQELDIAVLAWSPLAGGLLSGKYKRDDIKREMEESDGTRKFSNKQLGMLNEKNIRIIEEISRLAEQIGRTVSQVALNWLLRKQEITCSIIGARTVNQLEQNLGSLDFELTEKQCQSLDALNPVDYGNAHFFTDKEMFKNVIDGGLEIEGSFNSGKKNEKF